MSGDSGNFRLPVRPGPLPAKINAPGIFPAPGLGVFGSKVEYLIVPFGAGELIVEAQPEGQRQLVAHLEFVVDPRRRVGFVECRIDRDSLTGLLHLAQQERRERIAGLGEIVPRAVVAARAEAIEVERAAGAGRPPAGRERVMAVLDTNLRRVPPLHPRQVVRELPAIVLLVAELLPLLPDVRVRSVAGEN